MSASASELTGAVRSALGLTRHMRLRHQLRDSIELLAASEGHPELQAATADLQRVVEIQAARLRAVVEPEQPARKWNWGSAIIFAVFTVAFVLIEWYVLRPHVGEWWGKALIAVIGLLTLIFIGTGLNELFGPAEQ